MGRIMGKVKNVFKKIAGFFLNLKNVFRFRARDAKKEKKSKSDIALERVVTVATLLVVSLLVELFVFNYRHFQTMFNEPFTKEYDIPEGFVKNEDGTMSTIPGDHTIYINDINERIDTVMLEMVNVERPDEPVLVFFGASDYSHKYDTHLNERVLYNGEKRSYYLTYHLYGDCRSLRISPQIGDDQTFMVNIVLNPVVPIFFEAERVAFVFFILLVIYFIRPKSFLHKVKYAKLDIRYKASAIAIFYGITALLFWYMTNLNPVYQYEAGPNFAQYQELAEAFSEGSLHVLEEPNEVLKNLENPYDMEDRVNTLEANGEWYLFDHAYYNGHYYVYFGAVPVVLIYLPYYLITGEHIHNYVVIFIGMLLLLAAIFAVMDEFIKKYCKKCSVAMWFLMIEFMVMGSTIIYILKRPDFYSIPNTYGLMFGMWGMWCIMKSDSSKIKKDGSVSIKALNIPYLAVGSLLTVLVLGCRPQIFVFIALDIIILRKYIFNLEYLKSRDGIKSILAFGIPMAVIGIILMVYNAMRFSSPFDFGANYNLTFNDMRYRGFNIDRIPLGLFMYLLHPMNISTEYPYFGNIYVDPKYMGVTIQETTYGGVLMAFPFAIVGLLAFLLHKKFNKKDTLWKLSITSWILALIIVVVDTEMSGILARYFADFSIFIMLAGVCTSLMIVKHEEVKGKYLYNAFVWFLIACFIFECFYHINVFTLDSGDYLRNNRRDLFYHLYYMVGFGI